MSAWWKLPRATPVLLRHLLAYAELAEEDFATYARQAKTRMMLGAVAFIAGFFTLVMICVALIGAFWDTPHRMLTIYSMLGVFAVVTATAVIIGRARRSDQQTMFASVKREWREDRVILNRILAQDDDES